MEPNKENSMDVLVQALMDRKAALVARQKELEPLLGELKATHREVETINELLSFHRVTSSRNTDPESNEGYLAESTKQRESGSLVFQDIPPGLSKGLATWAFRVLRDKGPMTSRQLEDEIRNSIGEEFSEGALGLAIRRNSDFFEREGDKIKVKAPETE